MDNGVIMMYVKDGVMYPIAMTESQLQILQVLAKTLNPLHVIFDHPQGNAVNLLIQDKGDLN